MQDNKRILYRLVLDTEDMEQVMNEPGGKLFQMDTETGDLYDDEGYYWVKHDSIVESLAQERNLQNYIKRRQDIAALNPMHGSFSWVNPILLDEETKGLTRREKAKFLMLCTFLEADGKINTGADDVASGVAEILGVTRRTADQFVRKILGTGTVKQGKDGGLYAPTCITQGTISNAMKRCGRMDNFTRMYVTGIRRAYRSKKACSVLRYVVPILKYVHPKYNVVCSNPLFEELEEIKPLPIRKIFKLAGVNSPNLTQAIENLTTATFPTKSCGRQYLFARSGENETDIPSNGIYLNPNVFFAGSLQDEERIARLFHEKGCQ